METIDRVRRAEIDIAGITVEVFMLPNGSYVMSQEQVARIVEVHKFLVSRFLLSETLKALTGKDFTSHNFTYNDSITGRGQSGRIKAVPIEVASIFWAMQAQRGNSKATALICACVVETLERRCDRIFEVRKTGLLLV